MFTSLLVPLDRSSFAEQALPLALSIARRAGAKLDLVNVLAACDLEDRPAGWAPFDAEEGYHGKLHEQLYLDATAKWMMSMTPVATRTATLPGSALLPLTVAANIVQWANAEGTDLMVMTSHGLGMLKRIGLGSVANELIRGARIPVLLIPAGQQNCDLLSEPTLDNILIPLDGSRLCEKVLNPVLDLAQLMEAKICLLRVVEPGRDDTAPDGLPEKAYLDGIADWISALGLQVGTRVVVARNISEAIVAESELQRSSLIALATHGRGGLKRLVLGSVADKLIQSAALPLLIYHPGR